MSRSRASHPLSSICVRVVAICLLVTLACTALPAVTSHASPSNQTQPPLSVGTWNTMLHPWFPYQADVIKEIGKTNFDVLGLQEVWTDAAKDAIVSDPTVKAKYPYFHYTPPNQQSAYCSLDLPRSELEDLLSSIIVAGSDPRTFVQPNKPYDPITDFLSLGIAFRGQQICLEGIFSTVQGYPDDKSPYDVIDECYFQGCVKYSHGGSPGQLILSKQPINNVQDVSYDTFLEYRVVVYATIAGTKFAFTQLPYNYFEDTEEGAGFLQPGAQQPQMTQDMINAQPDIIVGDFNSGPNYQPEAYNLLLANGYHALTTQDTYCPAATHASFEPCKGRTGTFRSLAIDNIFVKNVPACFTPGTFARTPVSDHIGLSICNTAPVTQADSYSVNQGGALTVAAPGVLGNDTDSENDSLTAVKLTDPTHGSVTFNANGSFVYTPAANYSGTDSFTYKARDTSGAESAATSVTITINQTTSSAPSVTISPGGTCLADFRGQINLTLADSDTPLANLALSATSSNTTLLPVSAMTFGGNGANRTLTVAPIAGKSGSATVTLKVSDGGATTSITMKVLVGTSKSDSLTASDQPDILFGGDGNDTMQGGGGNDLLCGGSGDDKLYGSDGADTLDGGAGKDALYGQDNDDILLGGADDDNLQGGDGVDVLRGGDGNDKLNGGANNDSLFGENGNDTLTGGGGTDTFDGGAGTDKATDYDRSKGETSVNIP